MPKLAHLMPQKPNTMGVIEGFVGAIAQDIAGAITSQLANDVAQHGRSLNAVNVQVSSLAPTLERSIKQAVDSIRPQIDKLGKDLAARAITQQDMVKLQGDLVRALSNVKIPDYSESLARLEAMQPDLKPIMDKIDAIEFPTPEERPRVWHFDIKRNRNGLLKSVTATAEE